MKIAPEVATFGVRTPEEMVSILGTSASRGTGRRGAHAEFELTFLEG